MFSLLGIGAMILAGAFVVCVIALTVKWIKNKFREKLALKNAKKAAIADIKELVENCDNRMSLEELDRIASKEGYTHVMATVDNNGQIMGDLELIKDTSGGSSDVQRLLGDNGMLVVEK